MQVSEIMHKGVSTVQIHDSIKKVAALMKKKDIGSVPVYKNERAVGFVTDRDIVVSCVAQGHPVDDPISHAMNHDIFMVNENDDISIAAQKMKEKQVSRLLVTDAGGNPVGMVSLQDISHNFQNSEMTSDIVSGIKR